MTPVFRHLIAGALTVMLAHPFAGDVSAAQEGDAVREPAAPEYRSPYFDPKGVTVEHLVDLALNQRADLQAARARLIVAEGQLTQAGLKPNPQLELGIAPSEILGPRTNREIEAGVSQRFELGGKRSKRVEAARLDLERERGEVTALERRSAAGIRTAIVRAWAEDRRVAALDSLIRINEDLLKITRARLATGDVAPVEALLLEQEIDRLQADLVRAKSGLDTEIAALRTLAGLQASAPLLLADLANQPPRLDASLEDLTARALANRADLRAAQAAEQAADVKLRLARAKAVPDLTASLTYTGDREAAAPGEVSLSRRALRFGVTIEIPVSNRNQGDIQSASGDRLAAQREREFLEATIQRDVAIAYGKYRAAAELLALYSGKILPRARQLLATVRQAYAYGEFSVFDVLAEQRRTLEAETGLSGAASGCYAALAELETASGAPLPATMMGEAPLPPRGPEAFDARAFRRSIRRAAGPIPSAAGSIVELEPTKGKDQ